MGILPSSIVFYSHPLSGHSHRVELLLNMLELPYRTVTVDLLNKEQRSPLFLALNPFGSVPVIDDDGTIVWDSAAILVYLAKRYGGGRFLPEDPVGLSEVQRWLALAAGPLAHGPAAARRHLLFGLPSEPVQAQTIAKGLMETLDVFLSTHSFLAVEQLTLADLAFYSYVAHAPEGGIDLEPFESIRTWLGRVEQTQGFIPMKQSKVGLRAQEVVS